MGINFCTRYRPKTVPALSSFISFTYCRNQSIAVFWLPQRLSTQCLSIKFRKSSFLTSTSLCKGNTYFTQAAESFKNVMIEILSRPSLSCSNSSLLLLKTAWIIMHWHALCLLLRLTNSFVNPDCVNSTIVSSLLVTSVSWSSVSASRILHIKSRKLSLIMVNIYKMLNLRFLWVIELNVTATNATTLGYIASNITQPHSIIIMVWRGRLLCDQQDRLPVLPMCEWNAMLIIFPVQWAPLDQTSFRQAKSFLMIYKSNSSYIITFNLQPASCHYGTWRIGRWKLIKPSKTMYTREFWAIYFFCLAWYFAIKHALSSGEKLLQNCYAKFHSRLQWLMATFMFRTLDFTNYVKQLSVVFS